MSLPRVRMWLVVGLVIVAALVFTPAQAQFGRPPFTPPGGIAGRPGGIGGINGGIGGMPGGMAGRPGGINGGIAGGMPGGMGQHEWVCGGCGKVLGTGPVKPIIASCPACGVKFTNGLDFEVSRPGGGPPIGGPPMGGIGGMPGGPPMGGPPMGGANIPPTVPARPEPPQQNQPEPPVANNNNNIPAPAPAADNAAPANTGNSTATRTVLIVAAIGCGVLLLFAALGTFLYISATRSGKNDVPQRRRKRVYHDED
jgi:hypothetical protein